MIYSVACDTDHDRHSVVTKTQGLFATQSLPGFLYFLFTAVSSRLEKDIAIGKTLVSSRMIDRVTKKMSHPLYEVPVGFKWFVDGLIEGSLGFVGEESAGATFLRKMLQTPWTTDKDGFTPALLAAEMTATLPTKIQEKIYKSLEEELGVYLHLRPGGGQSDTGTKSQTGKAESGSDYTKEHGRRTHHSRINQGPRKWCSHWRTQIGNGEWMDRSKTIRYGRYL